MKKVIDGKTYNTETAEEIGSFSNGLGLRDFRNIDEALFVTKKGAYFLAGTGGAMTKYSEPVGNMTSGGFGIIPLSKSEALSWMERSDTPENIELYFSDVIEDA